MSDPVSSNDIEDVLSSIRRLVSDEATKPSRRAPEEEEPKVERLVLTPAFRVHENSQAIDDDAPATDDFLAREADPVEPFELSFAHRNDPVADGDPTNDAAEEEPQAAPVAQLEPDPAPEEDPVVAAIHEQVASHVSEQDPPEAFVAPEEAEDPVADTADDEDAAYDQLGQADESAEETPPAPLQIDASFEAEADWQPADDAEVGETDQHTSELPATTAEAPEAQAKTLEPEVPTGPPQPVDAMTLEARIAELEAAIEQNPQEWEPDGSDDGSSDETMPLSAETEDAPDLASALTGVTFEDAARMEAEDGPLEEETVEDPSAGDVEVAVSEDDMDEAAQDLQDELPVSEDPEPPLEVEALAVEIEAPEEPPVEEPVPEIAAHGAAIPLDVEPDNQIEAAGENILSDKFQMLDEEALRQMVSDLVREELQGVLGERITRNVRRLVRREIQRALAMRDLE